MNELKTKLPLEISTTAAMSVFVFQSGQNRGVRKKNPLFVVALLCSEDRRRSSEPRHHQPARASHSLLFLPLFFCIGDALG
jgi:hypothetical protein